ncbi:MAG: hypothetical protein R3E89_00300 [Thiolinea sp.]
MSNFNFLSDQFRDFKQAAQKLKAIFTVIPAPPVFMRASRWKLPYVALPPR